MTSSQLLHDLCSFATDVKRRNFKSTLNSANVLNVSKCVFAIEKIHFLGIKLTRKGWMALIPSKVQTILDFSKPK